MSTDNNGGGERRAKVGNRTDAVRLPAKRCTAGPKLTTLVPKLPVVVVGGGGGGGGERDSTSSVWCEMTVYEYIAHR